MTGIQGLGTREQLINFYSALMQADAQIPPDTPPADWMQAFDMLKSFTTSRQKRVRVLFFDELPWMDTDGSGFMAALEHFWNAWASAQSRLILVACGSAASWMINHLINNKGGLYNRLTRRIRLVPFSLSETETSFTAHSIRLDRYQIVQLYMVLGGIPFYLEQIGPGKSTFQEIDRFCFTEGGLLRNEFMNLYRSLFDHPDKHLSIIEALAKKNKGLTREEVIAETGLSNGGNTTRTIAELLESGFITATLPFKTMKVPFSKISFFYGGVSFPLFIEEINQELIFDIENADIRPEFNAIREYFSRTLKKKPITTDIAVRFSDSSVISATAKSDDINCINNTLIESVRFEFVKREIFRPQGWIIHQ